MLKTSKIEYKIGVDIGGTKMSAVLLSGERVIGESRLVTPKDNLDSFIVMLNALIEPLKEQAQKDKVRVKGIGIGIPGAINQGKVLYAPNLPFLNGVKIGEVLKEKIADNLDIVIDNDANCYVRAEALVGVGKKYKNVYGLTIGTGIGAGWWVNGNIYTGSHGSASEAGRMVIDFTNKLDLETAYHRLTQNNPQVIAEEAYQGDALANQVFEELGELLGVSIANIINLYDPEVVVIGGGTIESSDLFIRETKKTVKKFVVNQESQDIKVAVSKLGKLAGAIGAALLV
jgi:glucokinase